jgi:uncharacterized membrane protein
MNQRPKLHIVLSPADRFLEALGYVLLCLMWGIAMFAFRELPGTIPIHYDTSGKADSYGDKMFLLLLPVIPTAIFFAITALSKYPHIFNYIVTITEENARRQYSLALRLLRVLKIAVVLIFLVNVLFTYVFTKDINSGGSGWNIVFTFLILLLPAIIYCVAASRVK